MELKVNRSLEIKGVTEEHETKYGQKRAENENPTEEQLITAFDEAGLGELIQSEENRPEIKKLIVLSWDFDYMAKQKAKQAPQHQPGAVAIAVQSAGEETEPATPKSKVEEKFTHLRTVAFNAINQMVIEDGKNIQYNGKLKGQFTKYWDDLVKAYDNDEVLPSPVVAKQPSKKGKSSAAGASSEQHSTV